ncbi:MAG: GspE/PulE family protein [Candidatus Omnitrophota bacterium]
MAKIGEILVAKGMLTPEQLDAAMEESKRSGLVLGKTLVRLKLINEQELLNALGEQLGMHFYASLRGIVVPQAVIDAVPVKFVWHYKTMPLKLESNLLTIAVSDPMEVWSMEDIKLHLGYNVERVLATEKEILGAIRKYYGFGADTVNKILQQDDMKETARPQIDVIEDLEDSAHDVSVIKLVNQILSDAVTSRATDIHIEPYRDKVRVRYRIDGVLYDMNVSEQIKHLFKAIVSRVKIISDLNVVEKRTPQDGRAIIKVEGKQIDLRVSIIPCIYGEGVVIRILPIHKLFNLEELGFFSEDCKRIESLMKKPHGIMFLTGPTGSGKTTTLYACLSKLNQDKVKIITIEDPVEYELHGIMQIQVRPEVGLTFASAFRSILRHDPDIMMVGEVRDFETAELAIRTALTGHFIFSTLHTNDVASGATRLMDIGIEPYLLASSVNAFISQRLVRMICPDCKQERKDKTVLPEEFSNMQIYEGRGCEACKGIGYRGRTVIYEIIDIDANIQGLILNKASADQIKQKAKEMGMKTIKDLGIEKVRLGITTPEEVLHVTDWEG